MLILPIILIVLCVVACYPRWRQQAVIKQWYKEGELARHQSAYQHLFRSVDGFSLSRHSRTDLDAIDYTYGEIEFIPFIALLSLTKPNAKTVFYDLGSGTGTAVLACTMVFNIHKSCGIELFTLLHNAALNQQQRLLELPYYAKKARVLDFINANFLNCDFSDATLVFINATAFFGETWSKINQHMQQVNTGTIIITTSKKLSSEAFIVTKITTVYMSWGPVKAYIQERISNISRPQSS